MRGPLSSFDPRRHILTYSRSREWYEKCVKPQQSNPSFVDRFAQDESKYQPPAMLDPELQETYDSVVPDPSMVSAETARSAENLSLNPIDSVSVENGACESDASADETAPSYPCPVELPALKSFDLSLSVQQDMSTSQSHSGRNAEMEGFVTEAAGDMINTMMDIMNGNKRRGSRQSSSKGDLDKRRLGELPIWKKDMLRRIFSSALDQLAGSCGDSLPTSDKKADVDAGKKGRVKCDHCPKQTRLPSQMRYVLLTNSSRLLFFSIVLYVFLVF